MSGAPGELIKKGRKFRQGEETADILTDRKVTFRAVEPRWMSEYLPAIRQYYQTDDSPALQLVWPDLDGKYPWDPACDKDVSSVQKLLFKIA